MHITIKDCVALPCLSKAKVLAGQKGLNNIVSTISVLEYDGGLFEDSTHFLSSNELLLSSFYSLKDSVELQCHAIEYFQSTGTVGLVLFYLGYYLKTIHPQVIETANRIDFPIIVLPHDMQLRYSDVISEVMELILNEKKQSSDLVGNLSTIVGQLPHATKHIANVLRILSDHTKISCILTTEDNEMIASSYSPLYSTVDIGDITHFFTTQPQQSVYIREVDGQRLCCYFTQVTLSSTCRLNLYCIDRLGGFVPSKKYELAEFIRTFSLASCYHLDSTSPQALIPAILSGNQQWLTTIQRHVPLRQRDIDSCIVISHKTQTTRFLPNENILQIIRTLTHEHSLSVIADAYNEFIIIFTQFDRNTELNSWFLSQLAELLQLEKNALYLSSFDAIPFGGSLHLAFIRYCDSLQTAQIIYPNSHIFSVYEIDLTHRCNAAMASAKNEKSRLTQWLQPLLDHPDQNLMDTLCVYVLDTNCEIKTTAQQLFLHRNTVQYRLSKIRSLLHCDFTQMPFLYDAYLACAIHRVDQYTNQQ